MGLPGIGSINFLHVLLLCLFEISHKSDCICLLRPVFSNTREAVYSESQMARY